MEHIPFEKILSEYEISDYIKNSTAGFLDKAEQNSIDAGDIAGFYKNDVAKRIVQASKNGKLYREYPISTGLTRSATILRYSGRTAVKCLRAQSLMYRV